MILGILIYLRVVIILMLVVIVAVLLENILHWYVTQETKTKR